MDLYFNELSMKDMDHLKYDSITAMAAVYNELSKYNITTCRIDPEDNTRLFQMLKSMPNAVNIINFYFSFFRSPYESDTVEENQDKYFEHNWTFQGENCIGAALAFLLESACLSIYSQEWNIPFVEFLRDKDLKKARNICVREHVVLHIPQIQNKNEGELPKCRLQISDKKIALRNDHGMDVLEDFSKRLIRCPYIIEVVNSLPYNPYERKFIKRVRENGLIEIVLPWTDKGYGIVVKTTGRTMSETNRIAELIEEEYGYI